jgi:hypothetical protein
MDNLLRHLCIQALLPGFVMVALPAGASAQPRLMGPQMGNHGMARPPGSAAMTQPFRGMSPVATPSMASGMRPMFAAGGGTSTMGFGGGGMGSYNGQAYGGPGVSTEPQDYATETRPTEDKGMSRLLTASGVSNVNGLLRWPIGLAILAAPGADELSEQVEVLFEEAARQAAAGSVNPVIADEARQAVQKLRRILLKEKAERFGMPLAVYQESERFLNKLERAAKLFRDGMGRPAAQRDSNVSQK